MGSTSSKAPTITNTNFGTTKTGPIQIAKPKVAKSSTSSVTKSDVIGSMAAYTFSLASAAGNERVASYMSQAQQFGKQRAQKAWGKAQKNTESPIAETGSIDTTSMANPDEQSYVKWALDNWSKVA